MKSAPQFEDILKVAQRYNSRGEFSKENPGLYRRARKLGIMSKLAEQAGFQKTPHPRALHSLERCLLIAKDFKTHADFRKSHDNVYEWLKKQKLLRKFRELANFEIEDKCASIGEVSARDYLNRLLGANFKKEKNISWLNYVHGKNLELDGIDYGLKIAFEYNGFSHMEENVIKKDQFKARRCEEMGIKLIVITEPKRTRARDLYSLIPSQVAKELKRLNIPLINSEEIFEIKSNSAGFDFDSLAEIASKYKRRKDLKESESKVYNYLCNTDQINLFFSKHKKVTNKEGKLRRVTKNETILLAQNFKTRKSFYDKYPVHFSHAEDHGYIQELCLK